MGLERAHAEFVGQGEGLPVVGFRLLSLGRIGVGMDSAKQAQRKGLVSTCLLLPGQVERLQSLDNAGVQHPPPLLEKAAIGHFMPQSMLEGIGALGKELRLVEELGGLQVCQALLQRRFGQLGNGLQ